jgi:hypothetical protein
MGEERAEWEYNRGSKLGQDKLYMEYLNDILIVLMYNKSKKNK